LFLYDVEPPSSALRLDPATSAAVTLHWLGNDGLSGVNGMAVEVAAGSAAFRPWVSQTPEQPSAGASGGAVRFLGDPGASYQLRLTLNDAARNPAPPAVDVATLPSGPLRLLADGTTWDSAGTPGPRFSVKTPVRLLAAGDGSLMVIDAAGVISPSSSGGGRISLSTGVAVVDAALFPGSHVGLALDSAGAVHAF